MLPAMSPIELLRSMNMQQLAAVTCSSRHVRLAAGPGTGKTRALTARIAHLVASGEAEPARLLALTFTNKAAREMRSRLSDLLGPPQADLLTLGTFHSLCLAMLRVHIHHLQPDLPYRRNFAVYDETESLKVVRV